MLHIVLFQPEIPSNTGNIIRLCANTGAQLHLIHPLGFEMDDKRLKRAGLDYHEFTRVRLHDTYLDFVQQVMPRRCFGLSTHGKSNFYGTSFQAGDAFLFGPETRGLPAEMRNKLGDRHVLRLPMSPESRSLNLANTVAVVTYEVWRQQNFVGARV
jgi:tRNA (cytidine/uridine-2'-O-)-methyltransferase